MIKYSTSPSAHGPSSEEYCSALLPFANAYDLHIFCINANRSGEKVIVPLAGYAKNSSGGKNSCTLQEMLVMAKKKIAAGSGKTVAKLKAKRDRTTAGRREPIVQAMVWYREEHYAQLLSIFDDAELLPPKYADWLGRAEEKKTEVEAAGDQVIKVYIDPETFPQWCTKKNLRTDANARSQLAIEVVQAKSLQL